MGKKGYIDTVRGILSVMLWHIDASIQMEFNNNFYVRVHGKEACETMLCALQDMANGHYLRVSNYNFRTALNSNGLCILTYEGTYRDNLSVSVLLTDAGRQQLIKLLGAAIAQALTPEQIKEHEACVREWEIARDKR